MVHQIPQALSVREPPRPRHREDEPIAQPVDQLQRLVGCKPGITFHHNLFDPVGKLKLPQHSSEEYVPLPMTSSGVHDSDGHWNSEMLPAGYQQHHLESEGVAGVIVPAGFSPNRVLLATFTLQRRITDKMKHSVRGRRQSSQDI